MIYDLEIMAITSTEATNLNAHFLFDNPQEMVKALDMILKQGYDVIISEVREDG